MKYIAQYLPVEGEIKNGDTFLDDTLGPCVRKDDGSNSTWAEWAGGYTNLIITPEHKRAELFLCCRRDDWFPGDPQEAIGRISDKAIWVTHGMVFERSEIMVINKPVNKCECQDIPQFPWTNPNCIHLVELHHGGELCTRREFTPIVEIKCPTCKTFH